jgi:long-chain acyl-CoA synthetase
MTELFNLGDLVNRDADPQKTAIVDLFQPEGAQRFTHGDMDRMAMSAARMLARRDLPAGSRIAILSTNRIEYVGAYFGILRAGHVAVPINHKTADDTITYVLKDADVVLAFADSAQAPRVPGHIPVIGFDDPGAAGWIAQLDPGPFETWRPGPDDFCEILYTSGSTGRPKGVPLTHVGQLWMLRSRLRPSNGTAYSDQVAIVAQPLFHMAGLGAPRRCIFHHASLVMMPVFEARAYVRALIEHKVNTVQAVPTLLARVVKEVDLLGGEALAHITSITMGSAPLTQALHDKVRSTFPNAGISNGYGSTEAGGGVFGAHPDGLPTPPVALGVPLKEVEVRLVDGPSEDEGVMTIRSPAMLPYYLNLPEQTAKVMRDGWYYTSDVMRRDENGFFWFIGRADDMFVCSGENIYPGEVEKLLETHPGVHQAVVVPIPDDERGQVPVAFLVPRIGAEITVDKIKQFAVANGPAYQHPRRVKLLTELPWAGTNKIDRNALRRQAVELEQAGGWST